jgi:hypothetical protein
VRFSVRGEISKITKRTNFAFVDASALEYGAHLVQDVVLKPLIETEWIDINAGVVDLASHHTEPLVKPKGLCAFLESLLIK